jgi:hypothetical protein
MNEAVFNDLTSMGFDPAQSRKAAMCFTDAQTAIDWIFAGGKVSSLRCEYLPSIHLISLMMSGFLLVGHTYRKKICRPKDHPTGPCKVLLIYLPEQTPHGIRTRHLNLVLPFQSLAKRHLVSWILLGYRYACAAR